MTALPPSPGIGNGKAIAATAAGAMSAIVIWMVDQFMPHPLPAEICAAVQTLITLGAVYFTPHGNG